MPRLRSFATLTAALPIAALALVAALICAPFASPARAQSPPADGGAPERPAPERASPLPRGLLGAVVAIEATVPPEARSARTLGTTREGSGIVIDGDGLIVTVGYLVMEASSVEIESGGKKIPASVLAYDHETGLGLLRAAAAPAGVTPMELGSSARLGLRQPALVATSGGAAEAMTAFVVGRRQFAGYWEYLLDDAVFTSPPHPRFAGAALIDERGTLVGIGSLIVPDALRDGDTIYPGNMFIPVDALKPILGDLLANGKAARPPRPWLGVTTEEFRGRLFVRGAPEGAPAWNAGIRPGDMLIGVAGKPVDSLADFYRRVWALGAPGVDVPLLLLRGNAPVEVTVRSMDRYKWLKLSPSY